MHRSNIFYSSSLSYHSYSKLLKQLHEEHIRCSPCIQDNIEPLHVHVYMIQSNHSDKTLCILVLNQYTTESITRQHLKVEIMDEPDGIILNNVIPPSVTLIDQSDVCLIVTIVLSL